jgi:hypothetical protein
VPDSLLTLPARLTVRTARTILTTTRDLSQQALGVIDLIGQLIETPPAEPAAQPRRPRPVMVEPLAEDGASAQISVDPPWDGYDKLRAADIVARLGSADVAELTAIELYETTHRKRRTVLDRIARDLRRRPPA